jgi:hypothetical protein
VGYYMRYILTDERPVGVEDVQGVFASADGGYAVDCEGTEATIAYQGRPIGHVAINSPGDGLFDDERDELVEFAQDGDAVASGRVVTALRAARSIIAVQVLFGGGETDRTLDELGPLWTWLRENRQGLVQADGEGYYDGTELILPLE